jgi:hypothetical protein
MPSRPSEPGPTDETAVLVEQRPTGADEVRLGDRPVVRTIKVGGRPSMSPHAWWTPI